MELSQQLLAVGLVLALFLLAATAAQRRGWLRMNIQAHSRGDRQLELIERFTLTPQHQLHLMRIENRTLLIATSPKGIEVVESQAFNSVAAGGRA